MRIVFIGSAALACPTLTALIEDVNNEVLAVVSQPDKPKGRNLNIAPSPVKANAMEKGLRVITPDNINDSDSLNFIEKLHPDLIVVVAYGQMLGGKLLSLPLKGCINMHASLLPLYRGAAPIQWAIANGDKTTGVTAMFINERMDTGDIILQKPVPIEASDTAGSLHDKLAKEGATIIMKTVQFMRENKINRTAQIEENASFAPKLSKKEAKIDWTMPAEQIYNRVRGFNPWPMCWCLVSDNKTSQTLRVLKTRVENATGKPGEIVDITGDGPLVMTGRMAIRLITVQPQGKKVMDGKAYICGHDIKIGQRMT